MNGSKTQQLTVKISQELRAKLKAYSAFMNVPLGTFVNRTLIEKIVKIEKGQDEFIKIETKIGN